VLCLIAFLLSTSPGAAFELNERLELKILRGIYFNDGLIGQLPIPTGLGLRLNIREIRIAEPLETIITIRGKGGYPRVLLYRNAFGSPISSLITVPLEPGTEQVPTVGNIAYDKITADWELGLIQGLARRPQAGTNLFEAFLMYRGRFEKPRSDTPTVLFESVFPDREPLFNTVMFGGLNLDTVTVKPHGTKLGVYLEASAEWGPWFFGNRWQGDTDFLRLNAWTLGFIPLFDIRPEYERNTFSAYIALAGTFDWAVGRGVPLYVLGSVGGREPRMGLGALVRGFEKERFDTAMKVFGSAELRILLPSLGHPEFVPVLIGFADVGFYRDYYIDPLDTPSGLLLSVGGGLYLELFGTLQAGVSVGIPIIGERLDNRPVGILPAGRFHFRYE